MKDKNQLMESFKDKKLCVCDYTLTNGEQAPGVVFSNLEKYRIAQLLDEANIPQIVAGMPMMGDDEKKSVKHIARMGLNASVMAWNRADINDINASIECDVDSVVIAIGASEHQYRDVYGQDQQWVIDMICSAVSYASEHGMYVSCVAQDAPNADLGFLIDFAKAAKAAGADRFGYADILGNEDPFSCYERLKTLSQIVGMDIEIVASNDLGMATANSLAGLRAGAKFVSTTSMGIGKKGGCAALEEVCLGAKHIMDIPCDVDFTKFRGIAEAVALASGRPIPDGKPVIGGKVFVQEDGVAADGVVRDENGEAFDPAEIGSSRTVAIGKHSSRNTIISEMAQMGMQIDKDAAEELLKLVRQACTQMHRGISPRELFLLCEDMMNGADVFDSAQRTNHRGGPDPLTFFYVWHNITVEIF
jgi:homocitrate synthase NifV